MRIDLANLLLANAVVAQYSTDKQRLVIVWKLGSFYQASWANHENVKENFWVSPNHNLTAQRCKNELINT